ncbi:RNA polymerase II transcription factor B subunit 1 [Lignoscripta atroalba]|nr:RNA polymerase II transcription factor B subunit 1 [Lignoscripta atroalba]
MAPTRGSAAYKKKDGTLAMAKDAQSVSWTPTAPPGSQPALTLAVTSITNLQQTPASSAKVMLKIFAQPPGATASETHVFSFTSPLNARGEADAIKDALSKAILSAKIGNATPAAPGGGGGSTSAAMAIASAVSSTPGAGRDTNAWYDDGRLKSDVELQQSLLKANPPLSKTFMESLRTKPESISNSQFTSQFWSSRIHLLRAHAIEKNQTRGAYNVLSSIKPKTVDNATRLSISKEQIQLIFSQHSLVKRVYDENVPKLSEEIFWSRFFQSRLFKKLKGEKITDADPTDPVLDKYLQHDDEAERAKRLMASYIPHIIDIEGNEENHSQRKGNQPDLTMRPASVDKVPIIRTLNTLSEKIMSHVVPNDVDPSEPIGMDEETFNSLALRDLQGDAEENRIILNIKDQSRFFSSNKESTLSTEALLYAKQDPAHVLRSLRADLTATSSDLHLETAIGVNDDSSSSDDESSSHPKTRHVGSKASLSAATTQMLSAIVQQRAQSDDLSFSAPAFTIHSPSPPSTLSAPIFDRLSLTHATTTEFLHHFWHAFLSGSVSRADELSKLVETLDRAMDRIKAVADDAEAERMKEVEKVKKQVREHYERTQKKLRFDPESIGGGAKVVNQLLGPTVRAIGVAVGEYRKAVREAEREEEEGGG